MNVKDNFVFNDQNTSYIFALQSKIETKLH